MPRKQQKREREPAAKKDWLHFRTRPDLTERLDALADELGTNRSEAARILLERGLGTDIETAIVKQALFRIGKPLRLAIGKLMNEIAHELPDRVMREMQALGLDEPDDGSVPGGDEEFPEEQADSAPRTPRHRRLPG